MIIIKCSIFNNIYFNILFHLNYLLNFVIIQLFNISCKIDKKK